MLNNEGIALFLAILLYLIQYYLLVFQAATYLKAQHAGINLINRNQCN